MRLYVRDIYNLKIPKVSLKIIEYFLIYDELCVFYLFIKLGKPRRIRRLVLGISCFAEKTDISLLFCSFFLFFRVSNSFFICHSTSFLVFCFSLFSSISFIFSLSFSAKWYNARVLQ